MNKKRIAAIDWSKKIYLASYDDNDNIQVQEFKNKSLKDVILDNCNKFDILCLECTFESYNLIGHNAAIEAAKNNNIIVKTVNPRQTGNYRKTHKLTKSDEVDAASILKMYIENPKRFTEPKLVNKINEMECWNSIPDNLDALAINDIWKKRYNSLARFRNRKWEKLTKGQDLLVNEVLDTFNMLETNDEFLQKFGLLLGARKKTKIVKFELSKPFVLPFILIALSTTNRKEYLKRCGIYGNGYPNMIRSNFYYSRTVSLLGREFKTKSKSFKDIDTKLVSEKRKIIMKNLTTAVKAIYYEVNKNKNYNLSARQISKRTLTIAVL